MNDGGSVVLRAHNLKDLKLFGGAKQGLGTTGMMVKNVCIRLILK